AAYQVFSTGKQSLVLSALGNAVGGTFNIGSKFNQYVNSLVVPQNVTALGNFSNNPNLTLSGNLSNAGNFYAFSNYPNMTTAAITANNIANQRGGLMTTILPAAGLPGVNN